MELLSVFNVDIHHPNVDIHSTTKSYKYIGPVKMYDFIAVDQETGYIVMLRARMFRSLIPVLMIKERNIRARNITI